MSEASPPVDQIRYNLVWTKDFAGRVMSTKDPDRLDPRPNSWQKWTTVVLLLLVGVGGGLSYGALVGLRGTGAAFMIGSGLTFILMYSVMRRLGRSDHRARYERILGTGREQWVMLSSEGVILRADDGEVSLRWSAINCITTEDWGAILWTNLGGRIPLPTAAKPDGINRDTAVAMIEKWSEPS
jgi:hypothetical protein